MSLAVLIAHEAILWSARSFSRTPSFSAASKSARVKRARPPTRVDQCEIEWSITSPGISTAGGTSKLGIF